MEDPFPVAQGEGESKLTRKDEQIMARSPERARFMTDDVCADGQKCLVVDDGRGATRSPSVILSNTGQCPGFAFADTRNSWRRTASTD